MRKRILVIDQSRTIQLLLSTYFQMNGHQVIMCGTAQEGLTILAGLQEAPDVIFVNIDYQKEAYKVIEYVEANEQYANTSLVAMVLPEEQANIQRTLKERDVSYLAKPFHIQDALAFVSVPISGARFS